MRLPLSGVRKDNLLDEYVQRSRWLSGDCERTTSRQERQARELEPAQLSHDDPNERMREDSRADEMQREADVACVVPSAKEILDGVAADAGLSTFDHDTFRTGLKVIRTIVGVSSPRGHALNFSYVRL